MTKYLGFLVARGRRSELQGFFWAQIWYMPGQNSKIFRFGGLMQILVFQN